MRVLYVHHNPDTGGASNSLILLLEQLIRTGVEVFIATPDGPVIERFKNITSNIFITKSPLMTLTTSGVAYPWPRLLLGVLNARGYASQLEKVLHQVSPDLVHLNEVGLIHSAKICHDLGYKTVMHVRVVKNRNNPVYNKITSFYIKKYVNHLICIDESAKKSTTWKTNATVVYNPLKLSGTWDVAKKERKNINYLFLGNFLKQKGIFDVISAAVKLKDQKNVKFVIAGSNVKPNKFYDSLLGRFLDVTNIYPNIEKRIRKTIEKEKLTNIDLLGQIKVTKELFSTIDVLLLPIHMNEPSRSVFEAGAFGIPSILALWDIVEDVVEHKVNGMLIKERNIDELVETIIFMKNNPKLRTNMGLVCFNKFNKLNDPVKGAEVVKGIYSSLLNE